MTGQTPEWHVEQAERWLVTADKKAETPARQRACAELAQAHLRVAEVRAFLALRNEDTDAAEEDE